MAVRCASGQVFIDIARLVGDDWGMTRVKVGEFRDRASELIRRAERGETIIILNRDREVAKIVPITSRKPCPEGLLGCLAGTAEVRGDIETSIAAPDDWFQS